MTKEKLEKEAITKYKTGSYPQLHPDHYAFIHGYLAGAEPREKQIEELKRENAELKTDYEVLSCSVGDFGKLQDKLEEEQRKNNGLSDNLTKAIELLKWALHSDPEHDNLVDFDTKWKEAEQFIKENENV